jgi:hypothetical protein
MNLQSNKRRKFIELAEKRVTNALKQLSLIENLSRKSSYEYKTADVKKIFDTLEAKIHSAKNKFEKSTYSGAKTKYFTLGS